MQLLETGFFHADPHPGNLLRTKDGKLCILDFGLVTEMTQKQRQSIFDSIIHTIQKDYYKLAQDFDKLGFFPENSPSIEVYSDSITEFFRIALSNGGYKGVNFKVLAKTIAKYTYILPFRLPPFFTLIIRSIVILEGIAI